MKVGIDIDCTPAEARAFLGLPDVKPMQDALMKQLEERISAVLSGTDGDVLMKTWMPLGVQGMEQITKAFMSQFDMAVNPLREGRK